jgi:hypothetical protein
MIDAELRRLLRQSRRTHKCRQDPFALHLLFTPSGGVPTTPNTYSECKHPEISRVAFGYENFSCGEVPPWHLEPGTPPLTLFVRATSFGRLISEKAQATRLPR